MYSTVWNGTKQSLRKKKKYTTKHLENRTKTNTPKTKKDQNKHYENQVKKEHSMKEDKTKPKSNTKTKHQ